MKKIIDARYVNLKDRTIKSPSLFALIDKFSPLPSQSESYELEVVRTIKDRRNKEIPIVRLKPHTCKSFLTVQTGVDPIGFIAVCKECDRRFEAEIKEITPANNDLHHVKLSVNGYELVVSALHRERIISIEAIDEIFHKKTFVCEECGHKATTQHPHRWEGDDIRGRRCTDCGYTKEGELQRVKRELRERGWELKSFENLTPMQIYTHVYRAVYVNSTRQEEVQMEITARMEKKTVVSYVEGSLFGETEYSSLAEEKEVWEFTCKFVQEPSDKELFEKLIDIANKRGSLRFFREEVL
ncbi:MAG: hypothetical protein QW212_00115 [Nitrososphaerales archaeon]